VRSGAWLVAVRCATVVVAVAWWSGAARAGPPYLTDDPVPVDLGQGEFYLYATGDWGSDVRNVSFPAAEFNYGAWVDTQLHLSVPIAHSAPDGGPDHHGIGDLELGVKYRLIHESDTWPQVAVFPMLTLPAGDARNGLGNGRAWWRLPLWLQKSWGPWTSYGGGGYVINRAEGQRSFAFGGWLLQRDLNEKWTLGGEVYARGADIADGRGSTTFNLGGAYRFSPAFNLLFSAGHSVAGEHHAMAYLGLWWGFGGDSGARPPDDRAIPPPVQAGDVSRLPKRP